MAAVAANPASKLSTAARLGPSWKKTLPASQVGDDVQRDDLVHALQRAVLDHGRRPADAVGVERFLGGLEEQAHVAVPASFSST